MLHNDSIWQLLNVLSSKVLVKVHNQQRTYRTSNKILKLNQVKDLAHNNSMSEIGKIFDTTKNAVLGALYRDKVKNGYVPPPDSKYTGKKENYPKHLTSE